MTHAQVTALTYGLLAFIAVWATILIPQVILHLARFGRVDLRRVGTTAVVTLYACLTVAVVLLLGALALSLLASVQLVIVLGVYIAVQLAYCYWLKHQPVLDICVVASGFLLRAIAGVTLVEIADADRCCGSAGIYNLTHPAVSAELQRQKVAAIVAARPDVVVSANPGCILQIVAGLRAAGSSVPVVHIMRFLDDPGAFA